MFSLLLKDLISDFYYVWSWDTNLLFIIPDMTFPYKPSIGRRLIFLLSSDDDFDYHMRKRDQCTVRCFIANEGSEPPFCCLKVHITNLFVNKTMRCGSALCEFD